MPKGGHFAAFEQPELFDREAERMLLVHRRDVVEAIEIRQRLQVGFVLDQRRLALEAVHDRRAVAQQKDRVRALGEQLGFTVFSGFFLDAAAAHAKRSQQ